MNLSEKLYESLTSVESRFKEEKKNHKSKLGSPDWFFLLDSLTILFVTMNSNLWVLIYILNIFKIYSYPSTNICNLDQRVFLFVLSHNHKITTWSRSRNENGKKTVAALFCLHQHCETFSILFSSLFFPSLSMGRNFSDIKNNVKN